MIDYELFVFVINFILILLDATLGYQMAPLLARMGGMGGGGTRSIRRLLTGIVAFYMFLNCLGYFRGNHVLLVVVTFLILADGIGQLYMRRKWRKGQRNS